MIRKPTRTASTRPPNWFARAQALKETCLAMGIPLLSGKDSMYVDGMLEGPYGERRKVSGPCTLQITATSIVPDATKAVSLEPKVAGDLVYLLGETKDELGGSAFYELVGPPDNKIGLNAPLLNAQKNLALYRAYHNAVNKGLVRSAKALTRGGLGVAAAFACFGSGLGLELDLAKVPGPAGLDPARLLFSESCGRLLVTVSPEDKEAFEQAMAGHELGCLGWVIKDPVLIFNAYDEDSHMSEPIMKTPVAELKAAWEKLFGGLI